MRPNEGAGERHAGVPDSVERAGERRVGVPDSVELSVELVLLQV